MFYCMVCKHDHEINNHLDLSPCNLFIQVLDLHALIIGNIVLYAHVTKNLSLCKVFYYARSQSNILKNFPKMLLGISNFLLFMLPIMLQCEQY